MNTIEFLKWYKNADNPTDKEVDEKLVLLSKEERVKLARAMDSFDRLRLLKWFVDQLAKFGAVTLDSGETKTKYHEAIRLLKRAGM